ncbi:hypothetical protein WJX72_005517 [[Myrmecia] bisecta]|uniref:PA14 domain-containing protein n=1 Tax=[Myrmecia] bisecta TaxID=41462 RepID=A0AAW1PLL5_9CHLO
MKGLSLQAAVACCLLFLHLPAGDAELYAPCASDAECGPCQFCAELGTGPGQSSSATDTSSSSYDSSSIGGSSSVTDSTGPGTASSITSSIATGGYDLTTTSSVRRRGLLDTYSYTSSQAVGPSCQALSPTAEASAKCGNCKTCNNNGACVPNPDAGCGEADPLITGFDGHVFDFPGVHNATFNMLSERDHQLNVLMVPAGIKDDAHPDGGSYFGAIGFRYRSHRLLVEISAEGDMTVTLDDKQIPKQRMYMELEPNEEAIFEQEPHFPEVGHVVVFRTEVLAVSILAIQPTTVDLVHYRGHLDFVTTLLQRPRQMHGVLGQTLHNIARYPLNDMQFHGEGEASDYRVPNLLSSDFPYNLFSPTMPLQWPGQRMALEVLEAYEKLPAPKSAGGSKALKLPGFF